MRIYPQFILWTYVFLPAICLLLTPAFFYGIAKAQQQRVKLMTKAMNIRGKNAAALARNQVKNQQRRMIPNSRFSNGMGQKPFQLRSKRDVEPMDTFDVNNEKIGDSGMFERKTHWDQQEESINQLQNMWNMNSFDGNQNEGILRHSHLDGSGPEALNPVEEKVGNPRIYDDNKHNSKTHSYTGPFFGRNVYDDIVAEVNPFTNEPNQKETIIPFEKSANPEPTFKKKKNDKKIVQNYYYPPQNYYSSYYRDPYYARANEEEVQSEGIQRPELEGQLNGEPTVPFEKSANPEPTFKKKKKDKKIEQNYYYPHNYYSSYYTNPPHYNSYYERANEDSVKGEEMQMTELEGQLNGGETILFEKSANPEPTFKKKKKEKKIEQNYYYPHNYYSSYYTQPPNYNSYYERANEDNVQGEGIQTPELDGQLNGGETILFEKSANPEPTFKKKKKEKKIEQNYYYPHNYYSSYYTQPPNYNSYYERANEDNVQGEGIQTPELEGQQNGGETILFEKSANPEPTFKKKKKEKKIEQNYYYPHNYYSSYYTQPPNYNSYYERANEDNVQGEGIQTPELEGQQNGGETILFEKSASPEPTFKKKKGKTIVQNFYYPAHNHYSSHYTDPYYKRTNEEEGQVREMQRPEFEEQVNGEQPLELMEPKASDPRSHHHKKLGKHKGRFFRNSKNSEIIEATNLNIPELIPNGPNLMAENISPSDAKTTNIQEPLKDLSTQPLELMEPKEKVDSTQDSATKQTIPNEPNLMVENPLPDGAEIKNVKESRTSNHAEHNHDHPEDVGCKLDDDLFGIHTSQQDMLHKFDKSDKSEKPGTFDPYSYYERAVEEVSELNKKIAEAGKVIVPPLVHPKPIKVTHSETEQIDKKIIVPEQQPQVNYINSEENPDGGEYSERQENDNVGSIQQTSVDPTAPFKEKSASPNPEPHHHSHGYTHTHTHSHSHQKTFGAAKGIHSSSVISPGVIYQPHGHSNNHGSIQNTFSHSHSKNVGFDQTGQTGAFGHPNAHAGSGNQHFNSGFGHTGSHAAAQAIAGAQHFNTGGFGQSTAIANAQANDQNFNGGGFWNQPSAQAHAQAGSQTFGGGFGQASAQAAAQSSSSAHGGSQFFQVLGPSSFVNARSNEYVDGPWQFEEFVMPHLRDIPVRDVLHEMEADGVRFRRSIDSEQDLASGVDLASHIVHASLDKNPLIHPNGQQTPDDESQDMSFVTDIVDASINGNKKGTLNDAFKSANKNEREHSDNPLENARDVTFRGISSITDIVNKGLRLKRQVVEENFNTSIKKDANINQSDIEQLEMDDLKDAINKPNALLQTNNKTDEELVKQKSNHADTLQQSTPDELGSTVILSNATQNPTQVFNAPTTHDEEMIAMVNPNDLTTTEAITIEPSASNWDYFHNKEKHIHVIGFDWKTNSPEHDKRLDKQENETMTVNTKDSLTKEHIIHAENPKQKEEDISPDSIDNHQQNTMEENSFLGAANSEFVTKTSANLSGFKQDLTHANDLKNVDNLSQVDNKDFRQDELKNKKESNEDSSEESKETTKNVLPQVFTSTLPSTNISTLTPEEIEDIQFTIPDGTHQKNGTFNSENQVANKTSEDSFLVIGKHDKPFDSNDENILGMSINNTGEAKAEEIPQNPIFPLLGSPQNKSKIFFNVSGGLFDSIEAEMSVLTEEEKEEFIKKEMELITEVIQETLKDNDYRENDLGQHNKTQETQNEKVSSPHLFQDFHRDMDHEEYQRQARSATSADQTFDAILGAHKEKIESIQNEATDDGDLLMISFIGDSIVKDLEDRRNTAEHQNSTNELNETAIKRTRRKIVGYDQGHIPVTRLINDPTIKIDVPKTLDNVGAVVRHTFENPKAPMYHVRNMIGNTKNTIMSAAKIPPNNLLVPSQYEVAKVPGNARLGAINQKMLNSRSGAGTSAKQVQSTPEDPMGIMDAFQQIRSIVKQSMNSGKNLVRHANNAATDAKNVLYTAKHAAPKLIVPGKIPVIGSRSTIPNTKLLGKKAVLIAPRLLDIQEGNIVGETQQQPEQFIGVGNILDSVGLTNANRPEVELEKIVLDPSAIGVIKQSTRLNQRGSSTGDTPWMINNLKNNGKNLLGAQNKNVQENLESLREAEQSVGSKTLKDFFNKMHQEMKEILTSQHAERIRKRKEKTENLKSRPKYSKQKKDPKLSKKKPSRKTGDPINQPLQNPDIITGASNDNINYDKIIDENTHVTLPPEILHIFEDNSPQIKKLTNVQEIDTRIRQPEAKTIIKVTEKSQSSPDSPTDADKEQVGLNLMPELMKPFMGQPSKATLNEFMKENGDEVSSERKSSDLSKTSVDKPKVFTVTPLNLNLTFPTAVPLAPFNFSYLLPHPTAIAAPAPTMTTEEKSIASDMTLNDSIALTPDVNVKPKQSEISPVHFTKITNNQNQEEMIHRPIPNRLTEMPNNEDLGHVLGAINPMMFERYFKESLRANQTGTQAKTPARTDGMVGTSKGLVSESKEQVEELPYLKVKQQSPEHIPNTKTTPEENKNTQQELQNTENKSVDVMNTSNSTGRTSLDIPEQFQEPFMGLISHDEVNSSNKQYNNNLPEDNHPPSQQNGGDPVKDIVFPDEEEDYNFIM